MKSITVDYILLIIPFHFIISFFFLNEVYGILLLLLGFSFSYNTNNAINYARNYWKNYHNSYSNYKDIYRDNSNYVSQCLIAGGQDLNGCIGLDYKGNIFLPNSLKSYLTLKGWKSQKECQKKFKLDIHFLKEEKVCFLFLLKGTQ